MQTTVLLSLMNRTKIIPAVDPKDPTAGGSGFRPLKGTPEEASGISAVETSGALKDALEKINTVTTPFFTTGCGTSCNAEASSFWTRGYIEFAFNYIEIARDSPNYFLLFEQFNRHVIDTALDLPVEFNFQLKAAHFAKIAAVGYTTCVWITTAELPSVEESQKAWNQAAGFLKDFLCSFENPDLPVIY